LIDKILKNIDFRNVLKYLVVIILIVASFGYIFNQISLSELISSLKSVNYFWVVVSIIPIMISHWLRAVRQNSFLSQQETTPKHSTLFSAVMIGYFFNAFTLRLGEIVRPAIISYKAKIPLSTTTSTILLERIFDLFFLFLFFVFTIAVRKDLLISSRQAIDIDKITIAFVVIAVFIIAILNFRSISKFIKKRFPFLSKSKKTYNVLSNANSVLTKFSDGFDSLKSPRLYFQMFCYSSLIWMLYVLPNYFLIIGMDFHNTYQLTFVDAIVILVFSGLAITFSPTPGAIGLFHALVAETLVIFYSFERADAYAFAVISHFLNYIIQVSVGGYYFLIERNYFSFSKLKSLIEMEKKKSES